MREKREKREKRIQDRQEEKVLVAEQSLNTVHDVHSGNTAGVGNLLHLVYHSNNRIGLCEDHVLHSFLFGLVFVDDVDVVVLMMMMMMMMMK